MSEPSVAPELTRVEFSQHKRYDEAAAWLEQRFAGYLKTKEQGGPLAAAYDHDRHIFGGKFPALTAEEISGATYDDQTQRSKLPGIMPFAVRIYKPALKGRLKPDGVTFDIKTDARGEAKAECRRLWGLWYEEFRADRLLKKIVQRVRIAATEQGDADALGNPLIDDTGQNVLYVFRANLEVIF